MGFGWLGALACGAAIPLHFHIELGPWAEGADRIMAQGEGCGTTGDHSKHRIDESTCLIVRLSIPVSLNPCVPVSPDPYHQ